MRTLTGKEIRLMIESAANNLQNNKKKINDLNVFPVPDGDTGTNMGLTFGAAAATAIADTSKTAGDTIGILAKASLRNARGNSGVILSQILRGISVALKGKEVISVEDLKDAAIGGRDTAYRAVMKPTEGTILTVIRESAEFAEEAFENYDDAAEFFYAIIEAAKKSLAKTPEILPVLKQAGVVDAGGCGVVTLLEGAAEFLKTGEVIKLKEGGETFTATTKAQTADIDTANIRFCYCTEFIIQKSSPDRQTTQFEAAISHKGDCMLVIDDEDIVKVHIHTNHPGFVIEQALKLGELINIKIDNMKYQHSETIAEESEPQEMKKYGVVAVSAGSGLAEVMKSIGVDMIVEGGQTMNPSTQDLLDATMKVNAETVYILPNNKNIILAAEQVNDICEKNVVVIPTRNIPQGISAMLAFDPEAEDDANTAAMNEMMSLVKCGQVTFAARDSSVNGFEIHEGDVMGMVGSDITNIGSDLNDVSFELTEKMIDEDTAVVTIYYGEDTDEETAQALADRLSEKHKDIDFSVISGNQPVYYYMIAVE